MELNHKNALAPIAAGSSGCNSRDKPETVQKFGKHTGLKFQPRVKKETVCKPPSFYYRAKQKQKPEVPLLLSPEKKDNEDIEIEHLNKIDRIQSRVAMNGIKREKATVSPLPKALRELEDRVVRTIATDVLETGNLRVRCTISVAADPGSTVTVYNRKPQHSVAHSGIRFLPKAKPLRKLIRPDLKEITEKPVEERNLDMIDGKPAKISERRKPME